MWELLKEAVADGFWLIRRIHLHEKLLFRACLMNMNRRCTVSYIWAYSHIVGSFIQVPRVIAAIGAIQYAVEQASMVISGLSRPFSDRHCLCLHKGLRSGHIRIHIRCAVWTHCIKECKSVWRIVHRTSQCSSRLPILACKSCGPLSVISVSPLFSKWCVPLH